MKLDVDTIKKLREETGTGVLDVKKALESADGDYDKAKTDLKKKGLAKAKKKIGREANDGLVHAYIHTGGKVGSLVMIACETDFVAKTDEFQKLCHEVAMQIASGEYKNVKDLVKAPYVRDESTTIDDLVKETIAKLGENIEIKDFKRFSIR